MKKKENNEAENIAWFSIARNQSRQMTKYLSRGRQFISANDDFLKNEFTEEVKKWSEIDPPWPELTRMEDIRSELAIREIEFTSPQLMGYLSVIEMKVEKALNQNGPAHNSTYFEDLIQAYENRNKESN